jgi:hypothetical protein
MTKIAIDLRWSYSFPSYPLQWIIHRICSERFIKFSALKTSNFLPVAFSKYSFRMINVKSLYLYFFVEVVYCRRLTS